LASLDRPELAKVEVGFFLNAEKTAAKLVVQVVAKRALSAIAKEYSHKTCPPRHDRRHLLDHHARAPLLVVDVDDTIAKPQEKPLFR